MSYGFFVGKMITWSSTRYCRKQKGVMTMSKEFFKNGKFIPAGTLIVGVDISKNWFDAGAITPRGEFACRRGFRFTNNREGFEGFVARIEAWKEESGAGSFVVGMEPSGPYWKALAGYLEDLGATVCIVNPYNVNKAKAMYDNSRSKSDRKDSMVIAHMIDEGKYLSRVHLSEELEGLRLLMVHRESLTDNRTAVINEIRSILGEYFPELEKRFKDLTSNVALEVLKNYPLPCDLLNVGKDDLASALRKCSHYRLGITEARSLKELAAKSVGRRSALGCAREVIKLKASNLERLLKEIRDLEKMISDLVKGLEVYKYLSSIPNVGPITIAALLIGTGDLTQYSSAEQVLKVVGYDVCEYSSGKWKGQRHIGKHGNPISRKYLYQAGVRSAMSKGIYHEKYLSLRSCGKPAPKAYVALACELVRVMFSLARDSRSFERDYIPQNQKGKAVRNEQTQIRAKTA
jgi:transposase